MNVKASLRCVRCGVALLPPVYGVNGSLTADAEDLAGPCISPIDGSVEAAHRQVHVVVSTPGQVDPVIVYLSGDD